MKASIATIATAKSPIAIIATAIAIAFGLVVLLGYFIPAGTSISAPLMQLRSYIIDWASVLAAFATLVAILGWIGVQWRKVRARRNRDWYSVFALLGFAAVVLFGLYAYLAGRMFDFTRVVNYIQVPVEASLMAALAIVLTLASFRLFQRRRGLMPVVFAISALVFLLVNSGLLATQATSPFPQVGLAVLQLLPVAGGRGILLGIALGSILAGLRVLLGAERPYGG